MANIEPPSLPTDGEDSVPDPAGIVPAQEDAFSQREAHDIGGRVVEGSGLLWGTATLLRVLQLVTIAVLARLLTPTDYGIVVLAGTIVGLISAFLSLELSSAIIRTPELTRGHMDTAFTLSAIKGIVVALVLALLAWPTAWWMDDSRLFPVMLALAVPALVSSLHNPHFLLYARNLDFTADAKRQALAAVGGSALGIGVAIILQSYWALVASAWATAFLTTALSYWRVPGRPGWSFSRSSELLSFGGWLTAIGILDTINNRIDYLLISRLSSRQLGAYHIGQQITTLVTGDITQTLGRTLLPAFSIMSGDMARLRRNYREVQAVALAIALPIGFGTAALASTIVYVFVGRQWDLAVPVIRLLGPLIALQTAFAGVEALALSLNKGRMLFYRTATFFVVRVSLMFAGFYLGGFMGIVYARLISGSFFLVYGLYMASRLIDARMLDPVFASWRSIVAVSAMWLVLTILPSPVLSDFTYLFQLGILIGQVTIGGITYVGIHAALWLLSGRPPGAETRLYDQGRSVISKLIEFAQRKQKKS